MFIFACPKMNQKGQPFTRRFAAGSTVSNYPALLKITGRCETRTPLRGVYTPLAGCSDSPRALPVIFPLLGCVKWQKFSMLVLGTHSAPLSIAAGCHFLASSFGQAANRRQFRMPTKEEDKNINDLQFNAHLIVHFLCLPKENEPKERAAVHLVRLCRTSLCYSK